MTAISPAHLLIRKSGIHGYGCYTTVAIPGGTHIIEYTGTRLSKEEADELYAERLDTYLFWIGEGKYVMDGDDVAAFINHSCNPNCETVEIDGRIWIKAVRNIAPGEELTYEYNLHDSDDDDADCHCGAVKCRGTMFSDDEVKRRARLARKKARAKNS